MAPTGDGGPATSAVLAGPVALAVNHARQAAWKHGRSMPGFRSSTNQRYHLGIFFGYSLVKLLLCLKFFVEIFFQKNWGGDVTF